MRHYSRALIAVILVAIASLSFAATPERSKGISIHMLPMRTAEIGSQKWGFVVSYAEYLKPEKEQPVLQSVSKVRAFIQKQDKSVQENGIWIVTTHPNAYSKPERKLLEDIKILCQREAIPLFIARGSNLPNGWQRYDTAS